MFDFENITDVIKNVQIYPAKKRIEINDKMSKTLFKLPDDTYQKIVEEHKSQGVVEVKNHKKFGKIKSSFSLQHSDGYSDKNPSR